MQIIPCISVGIQLEKTAVDPTSGWSFSLDCQVTGGGGEEVDGQDERGVDVRIHQPGRLRRRAQLGHAVVRWRAGVWHLDENCAGLAQIMRLGPTF